MRRQTYGYLSGRRRHFPLTGTKLYCSLTEARVWTTCPRLLPDSRLARTQTCDSRVQLPSRYTTSPYTHGWRGEKLKNQLGSCIWPRITHCTAAQFYRSLSWWAWVSHMSLPLCLKRLRNPQNRKCTTYCIVVRGDRATSIGNMDKNLWSLNLWFLRYASGQTYRQLIAVFALLPGEGGELTIQNWICVIRIPSVATILLSDFVKRGCSEWAQVLERSQLLVGWHGLTVVNLQALPPRYRSYTWWSLTYPDALSYILRVASPLPGQRLHVWRGCSGGVYCSSYTVSVWWGGAVE